jgi:serine/threonine protein kinase
MKTYTFVGTPLYLAPNLFEVFAQRAEPFQFYNLFKADAFSLGLTLLFAITLKSPKLLNALENKEKLMSRINEVEEIDENFYKLL